jgi:Flp pilus assembly protein TadD
MPPSNDPQRRTDSYYSWGVCAFLLVAIGLIYGQTLGHKLLDYDDNGFVYDSPQVRAGLTAEGIRWAFTEGPFGEWYPLAPLSHMLDCQLFGLEAWGHHLTNVLLHAAASIALFLVLRRMSGELWPSAFVAMLFAIHPQHVESVAWVSERRDVLSGLFFVLTLGAYLGYVRHGRSPARYALVAVLFALGLMSKPMLVTLPALLVLLDFWPLARFGSASDTPPWTRSAQRPSTLRLVLEKLPLVALAAGDCLMTLRTHNSGNVPLAWSVRIGNAAVSCVTYVVQFFYPVDLAAFYPTPPGGPPIWKVAGAIAILAGVSLATVIWRRRCPYFFVGWFWYLGMLSPVLGLVTVSHHAMADRYMYLPGIGLYIALAWGAARLAAGSAEGRWALGTCAGLVTAVLVICAAWQTSYWRNDETLWRHALACTTDNGEAELGLADALAHQGRIEQAVPHYRRAQQFAVDSSPFNNLGLVMIQQHKLGEAIAEFRRAVQFEPNSYRAHANLGLALTELKQFDEAEKQFRRALEINPLAASSHWGLAHLLRLEGKLDKASAEFAQAVQLDPRNALARQDFAQTLLQLGRIDEAKSEYLRLLEIDPQNSAARQNLDRLRGTVAPPAP